MMEQSTKIKIYWYSKGERHPLEQIWVAYHTLFKTGTDDSYLVQSIEMCNPSL